MVDSPPPAAAALIMKTVLYVVGKTDKDYLNAGIDEYCRRIARYTSFEMVVIPDVKNAKSLTEDVQRQKEGELINKQLEQSDFVVLLDEKGTERSSVEMAEWMNGVFLQGAKRLVFVVGGPYGFSPEGYARANQKISLSKLTFPHQLVRLLFVEQLYRCHTILKGEPYHHI